MTAIEQLRNWVHHNVCLTGEEHDEFKALLAAVEADLKPAEEPGDNALIECDGCDGTGVMEGWNKRDGTSCPKCGGTGTMRPTVVTINQPALNQPMESTPINVPKKLALCGHVAYRNHDDLCVEPCCFRAAYVYPAGMKARMAGDTKPEGESLITDQPFRAAACSMSGKCDRKDVRLYTLPGGIQSYYCDEHKPWGAKLAHRAKPA